MPFFRIALSLAVFATAFVLRADETLVAESNRWAPFNGDPASEKPGYAIEVMKAIFEPKGVKVVYKLQTWSKTLRDAEEGKCDVAIAAEKSDNPRLLFPCEEIAEVRFSFYTVRHSKWRYAGPESLKKISLGVIEAYAYEPEIDRYLADENNVNRVFVAQGENALEGNVKKLLAGRLDAIIDSPQAVSWTLKNLSLPDSTLVESGSAKDVQAHYIAFSPAKPSSQRYARIFDEGMKELRKSGRLADILSRYGLKDWRR